MEKSDKREKIDASEKSGTGLFIGRFQPFHNAHLSDVKLALTECNKVIIAIGSSQESGTKENPFSYEERAKMIENTLKAHNLLGYILVPVPDINDDRRWVESVRRIVPEFDLAYTGNHLTEKLFKAEHVRVRKIKLIPHINATEIRKRILQGSNWEELVPKEVSVFLRGIRGMERVRGVKDG